MRSNLGRQSDGRQDLELVRDIVRSRLRFLFCVIRVQLARSEWTLAGAPDVSRRPIPIHQDQQR
jgi:hypothetical protein